MASPPPRNVLRSISTIVSRQRATLQPKTKKGGPEESGPPQENIRSALALRELEAAAGLGAAVLLALDDARIAGQEAGALDRRAQRRLEPGQRLGDAVLDCSGLARKPAALDGRDDVILRRGGRRSRTAG